MYIVGGYDVNYTSLDTMYRISSNATMEPRASLDQPRGDVTAVSMAIMPPFRVDLRIPTISVNHCPVSNNILPRRIPGRRLLP